jgi:hypothetical protein
MVRSTATSWKIGLAVTALTLPLWQLPAMADDRLAEKAETRPQPLEPKAVRVILLPPASDALLAARYPDEVKTAPIIMVKPVENAAIAQPRPQQVETASIMLQPAGNAAIVEQRPEPAKIQEDVAPVETPSLPERRPRIALLPPASNPIVASPQPEPTTTQDDATSAEIPSLPGRSPVRQAPFRSEVVENGPSAAATSPQPVSEAGPKSDKPPIKRFLDGLQFWKK